MSNYEEGLRAIKAQPSEWCAVILEESNGRLRMLQMDIMMHVIS